MCVHRWLLSLRTPGGLVNAATPSFIYASYIVTCIYMQTVKKHQLIILSIAVVTISAFIIKSITRRHVVPIDNSIQTEETQGVNIPLALTVFDAVVGVPQTRLMLPYPSRGFYGLGANVITTSVQGKDVFFNKAIHIETTSDYDVSKGEEFVTIDASGIRKLRAGETLDAFVGSLDPQSLEGQYAKSGNVETLGGRKYFVFKITEGVSVWTAYTVSGEDIVSISMAYKSTDGPQSDSINARNAQLFREMLTGMSER